MCRTELATKEHMLDHGQLGPPSPAVSFSPTIPSPPAFSLTSESSGSESTEREPTLTQAEVDEAEELERQMSRSMALAEKDGEDEDDDAKTVKPDVQVSEPLDTADVGSPSAVAVASTPNPRPPVIPPNRRPQSNTPGLSHPSDLSAQLSSNAKLAALRGGLSIVPQPSPSLSPNHLRVPTDPPLLINPKCSGYFVEPVRLIAPGSLILLTVILHR